MTSANLITDGSLAGELPAIPACEPPAADLFGQRAERLVRLSNGHALDGYLKFAAALSRAQQQVLDQCEREGEGPADANGRNSPPLIADRLLRMPAWHRRLRAVLDAVPGDALPGPALQTLHGLLAAPVAALEAAAGDLLNGRFERLAPGTMPFLAAGLQVHWTTLARQSGQLPTPEHQSCDCPLCGALPLGSVVRVGGPHQGLRYLICSLCSTQWHYTRVQCGACGSTKGINYLSVEGGSGAVKAETCDECGAYVKIFYMDKDINLEIGADDLATLALDVLVDEAGFQRVGPNLLLQPA